MKVLRSTFPKIYLFIVVFLSIATNESLNAQTCPDIPFPTGQMDLRTCTTPIPVCSSTDVTINGAFLSNPGGCFDCNSGDEVILDLYVNITNTAENTPSISISGDLTSGNQTCEMMRCGGMILPMSGTTAGDGVQDVYLGQVEYVCGRLLELNDILLVVSDGGTVSTCPMDCSNIPIKCSQEIATLGIAPPLICPPAANRELVNPCPGTTTGAINIVGTGGLAPYTFTLGTTAVSGTSVSFAGLAAGNYTVTIEDANLCTVSCTYNLTDQNACESYTFIACDDGNPCTENDQITNDACTGDLCIPCTGTAIDACNILTVQACDDNNPCTENDEETIDACTGSACVPCAGTPIAACNTTSRVNCDDGNPCTINDWQRIDDCTGGICIPCSGSGTSDCFVTSFQPCDDGDPCTINDVMIMDACNMGICEPCMGMPVTAPTCDPTCEVYNPATCSCDPIILDCDDNDCNTIDFYDTVTCKCINSPIPVSSCDDGLCYTNDFYDPLTCNCVNEPITIPDCDDNDCATDDVYNFYTCECEYIPVCTNADDAGEIGFNQGNCGPFDPAPIVSITEATGGCGDIEYLWLKSNQNVPLSTGTTYWNPIPYSDSPTYDPPFMASGVMCFVRCARTSTCEHYIKESNVVCITAGGFQDCDDYDCTTEDSYNSSTCECEHTVVTTVDCDDNDCSTTDHFNPETCECEYEDQCDNVDDPGLIGDAQSSCVPFNPLPLTSIEDASGGCGDIQYMWIMSHVNVNSGSYIGSPWSVVPGANDPTFDPGFITETTYYRRCARSVGCHSWIAESNILCIEVGISENCDDGNCNTVDGYDPITCECVFTPVTPNCDDNDCATEDSYNPLNCECINTPIDLPNCDDSDCNTIDTFDESTCSCVNTIIPPPNCDDGDCNTTDTYNSLLCICVHTVIPPPSCDDNDCTTTDRYNLLTCECENIDIDLPDCDDNDCNTIDQYNTTTCVCEYTPVETSTCDDNNCNTQDNYNALTCECEFTPINPPNCNDNDCNTDDSYDATNCECVNTPINPPSCDDNDCTTDDSYDATNCTCLNTPITPPSCDDNDCNTDDSYDTTNCVCVNTPITEPDCDDDDCTTADVYNSETCMCEYTLNPIPTCNDNDCNTEDIYNANTCQCVNIQIPPPSCDDNDCTTDDSYNSATCECDNVPITPPSCDDDDCATSDVFNPLTCECENTPVTPGSCDDNNCATFDSYNATTCECVYQPVSLCNFDTEVDICLEQVGNTNEWIATLTIDDINLIVPGNCDETPDVTFSQTTFPCNTNSPVDVTVTVCDANVGTSCCEQTISVSIVDKDPPQILDCPESQEVDCSVNINLNNLSPFGSLTIFGSDVFDNCQGLLQIERDVDDQRDDCGLGDIVRTWTITDIGGNQATCSQTLTLVNDNPLTAADFVPAVSDIGPVSCNNIPDAPTLSVGNGFDGCENAVLESFNEEIGNQNGGANCSFDITRTWTFIDECQDDPIVITQIVTVTDLVPPTISSVDPISLVEEVCFRDIDFNITVGDNCSSDSDFTFTTMGYNGDFTVVDAQPNNDNGNFSFTGVFCDGTTTFDLIVTDACGNEQSTSVTVTIDGKCGIPICRKWITTLDENGEDILFAQDLIRPWESDPSICPNIEYSFSFSPDDINDNSILIDCNSFPDISGNISFGVYFWADGAQFGEEVSCAPSDRPATVSYTNFAEECIGSLPPGVIQGRIAEEDLEGIKDVEVTLFGTDIDPVMTTFEGFYAFPAMDYGESYTITPKKDINPLNGVSTLDIIHLQKHILGLNDLDGPYKRIAADVNKSSSITAIDIVELRKLILGVYDKFPNNTSWRIIDGSYIFPDPQNPFVQKFPESYHIDEFVNPMLLNFVGVKVGDLNDSASANGLTANTEFRSGDIAALAYKNRTFAAGENISTEIFLDGLEGLQGAQFEIRIDNELLKDFSIQFDINSLLGPEFINLALVDEGIIRVSWQSLNEKIEDGDRLSLFTLKSTARSNGDMANAFTLSDGFFANEVYVDEVPADIMLQTFEGDLSMASRLYQNVPNPWSNETKIPFYLSSDQNLKFRVFDTKGVLVKEIESFYEKGMHDLHLTKNDLYASGLYYIEMISGSERHISKMILLD